MSVQELPACGGALMSSVYVWQVIYESSLGFASPDVLLKAVIPIVIDIRILPCSVIFTLVEVVLLADTVRPPAPPL